MKKSKNFLLITLAFIAGGFAVLATNFALAHGGDTNLIHGCVRNNGLLAGFVRIVGASTNCNGNESPLDWPKTAGGESSNGLICGTECSLKDLLHRLNRTDLVNVNLDDAQILVGHFQNQDVNNSSFVYAILWASNFSGANLTNSNFTNANLTSVDFSNSNTTLTNVNFTGANFSFAYLLGADFSSTNVTDALWHGTTCPDGTNSDDNGNTCEGHLTP